MPVLASNLKTVFHPPPSIPWLEYATTHVPWSLIPGKDNPLEEAIEACVLSDPKRKTVRGVFPKEWFWNKVIRETLSYISAQFFHVLCVWDIRLFRMKSKAPRLPWMQPAASLGSGEGTADFVQPQPWALRQGSGRPQSAFARIWKPRFSCFVLSFVNSPLHFPMPLMLSLLSTHSTSCFLRAQCYW